MTDVNDGESGTWLRYQEFVLKELRRLNEGQDRLTDGMGKVRVDVAMLQVKSGVWGLIGGVVAVVAARIGLK